MSTHFYGWKRDKKDERDYKYPIKISSGSLPASVDLRATCSPVRDQGQLGSCTGFAMSVGLREFMENLQGGDFTGLSPLFLYYEERALEGTIGQDSGAEIRDGMKVLQNIGCAPEADDPYDIAKFKDAPSAQAVQDALPFVIGEYHSLTDLAEMQDCLASGLGFVIGFFVYESFESEAVAKTGIMPMPKPGEQLLGGHAVFVCGYEDDPTWPGGGFLIVKNSWGAGWGDHGYFYMPYMYIQSAYSSDYWTATFPIVPVPPPTPAPGCLGALIKKIFG